MTDITSVDLARLPGGNLEQASPDLLRAMVKTFAEALMGAEADAACGAPYGQVSEERVNYRNGVRGPAVGHAGRDDRPGDPAAARSCVHGRHVRRPGDASRLATACRWPRSTAGRRSSSPWEPGNRESAIPARSGTSG